MRIVGEGGMKPEHEIIFRKLTEEQIKTLTVWGEARGEIFEGKMAVDGVIINRAIKGRESIHDICLAKNQFSCFLESDPNFHMMLVISAQFSHLAMSIKGMDSCLRAVQAVQAMGIPEAIGNATFYRVHGTRNSWFDNAVAQGKLKKVCDIGHHEFFEEII
jgi:spore germination cell wall hydrolase CwlJ-like protein